MSAVSFPAMPLYWKDWLTGESILPMTPEQECAFFRLLLHAWGSSQPCTLPDDERALAQMAKQSLARWRKIRGPVMDQFVMVDGRLRNPKQWSVYVDAIAHRERRAAAGSKGGNARAMLQQSPSNDVAKPCPSVAVAVASSVTDEQITEKENPPIGGQKKDEPKLVATKRRGVSLPEGWEPNRKHNQIAADCRVDCVVEAEHFRDWALSKGQVFRDWDAAFRNWLRNAKKFNGNKPAAGSEATKYHSEYPGRGRNGSSSLVPVGELSVNGQRRWSGERWEPV